MLRPLLLLLALTGCVSSEVEPLPPPPAGPPAPALAVDLPHLRFEPTRARVLQDLEDGEDPYDGAFRGTFRPPLDSPTLRDDLCALLRERGSFTTVHALPSQPDDTTPQRVRNARALGAELLLELEVDEARVIFVDTNWLHPVKIVNLVLCSLLIFPAVDPPNWFLPGEDYGFDVRGRWRLRTTSDGAVLARGPFHSTFTDAFAPLDLGLWPSRGWYVLGFLRTPNCLEIDDWDDIARTLQPAGTQTLLHTWVQTVEDATRP